MDHPEIEFDAYDCGYWHGCLGRKWVAAMAQNRLELGRDLTGPERRSFVAGWCAGLAERARNDYADHVERQVNEEYKDDIPF